MSTFSHRCLWASVFFLVSFSPHEANAWEDVGALQSACLRLALSSVNCAVADEPDTQRYPEPETLGLSPEKDPAGLRRDVYYFLGWQFAIIGVLYASPEGFSGWSKEQKEEKDFGSWWSNVKNPIWDSDDHFINYGLHPYWGATYFVRAQERGYGNKAAFWYSFALSSLYEFGAEAIFEEPSIQDFVVTPIVGSLIGTQFVRLRHNIRSRVAQEGHYRRGDRWWLALTDPLGGVSRLTDRMFGRGTNVQVRPLLSQRKFHGDSGRDDLSEPFYGVKMTLHW